MTELYPERKVYDDTNETDDYRETDDHCHWLCGLSWIRASLHFSVTISGQGSFGSLRLPSRSLYPGTRRLL
jgi:hypothetical protein